MLAVAYDTFIPEMVTVKFFTSEGNDFNFHYSLTVFIRAIDFMFHGQTSLKF